MSEIVIKKIDESKCQNSGSFLQTPFWCSFKARHGWTYRRFLIDEKECGVLIRSFCKKMFSIAYIPLFPKIQSTELQDKTKIALTLNKIAMALKQFLPKNTIAVRFDPDISFDTPKARNDFNAEIIKLAHSNSIKLKKSSVDIQPPDSTQVDLTQDLDIILEKMHQKWRYNIRLSERKGVIVKHYLGNSLNLSEKVDKFYELTKETNLRDGNSSHAKSYYLDLITYSAQEIAKGNDVPVISLYIAEHEGEEIASIMTLFSHDESIYLYGASSNKKRNLMPNHLLQWTAIKDAKNFGSKYYDLYGMPPECKNENHPLHGLYMFKSNFGGKNIHRAGSFDVPLNMFYPLYSMLEKLRSFWHKVILKKIRGR